MQTFKYPSRSSGATHTVTVGANNYISCTCRGFDTPSKCWHVREVAEKLNIPTHARSNTPALPFVDDELTKRLKPFPHQNALQLKGLPSDNIFDHEMRFGKTKMLGSLTDRVSADPPLQFFEPMLARPLKDDQTIDGFMRLLSDDTHVQEPKYDGIRALVHVSTTSAGRMTMWTRLGNTFSLPIHIIDVGQLLRPGYYDGELYVPGGTSTDVKATKNRHKLKLVLFDMLFLGTQDIRNFKWHERRLLLETATSFLNGTDIHLSTLHKVGTAGLEEIWARGGEGVLVKDRSARYECGKRIAGWTKFKKKQHATVRVIGFKSGELGPHSRLVCVDKNSVEVKVKALNDRWRANLAREDVAAQVIGAELVISYNVKTDAKNKYRHPMAEYFVDPTIDALVK